jgi:hypothetical protein
MLTECCYGDSRVLLRVVLTVIMLSVIIPDVVKLSIVAPFESFQYDFDQFFSFFEVVNAF